MTDLIQTIARAIWRCPLSSEGNEGRVRQWPPRCDEMRRELLDQAAFAITALHDAGYAIVPREPTHEMCQVGDPARFAPDDTEAIWSAMVEIAAITTGERNG